MFKLVCRVVTPCLNTQFSNYITACDLITEISFELRMETIFLLLMIFSQLCYATLSSSERKAWKFRPEEDSNPDLCDSNRLLLKVAQHIEQIKLRRSLTINTLQYQRQQILPVSGKNMRIPNNIQCRAKDISAGQQSSHATNKEVVDIPSCRV